MRDWMKEGWISRLEGDGMDPSEEAANIPRPASLSDGHCNIIYVRITRYSYALETHFRYPWMRITKSVETRCILSTAREPPLKPTAQKLKSSASLLKSYIALASASMEPLAYQG